MANTPSLMLSPKIPRMNSASTIQNRPLTALIKLPTMPPKLAIFSVRAAPLRRGARP